MRFDIVTLFPQIFSPFLELGVGGRAFQDNLATAKFWNPRDYCNDKHKNVDDRPFGGGSGMVLKPEPLAAALRAAKAENNKAKIVYLTPRGSLFDDTKAREMALTDGCILLCGRYRGVDERVTEALVDTELSIGDYVLSGGELAAMVVIEAVLRHIPGVLGCDRSADEDSFAAGVLDNPCYTRPAIFEGRAVPDVLLSGDHKAIARWRLRHSLNITARRRPDLLRKT